MHGGHILVEVEVEAEAEVEAAATALFHDADEGEFELTD